MRVLLAIHDSPSSSAAVEATRRLLLTRECEVVVLTVVPPLATGVAHRHPVIGKMVGRLRAATRDSQEQSAWQLVQRVGAHLCDSGARVEMRVRWQRRLADEIVETARECRCDVIVIGARTPQGALRWFSGSVSGSLVKRAPCPVLIAPLATAAISATQSPELIRKGATSIAH